MYEEHKHLDDYCDVLKEIHINGIKHNSIVFNEKGQKIPFLFRSIRYLIALLSFGIHLGYCAASYIPTEYLLVVKRASFEAPVVDEEYCRQNKIVYEEIKPQAKVITIETLKNYNIGANAITEKTKIRPCCKNELPLITIDSALHKQYYDEAIRLIDEANESKAKAKKNMPKIELEQIIIPVQTEAQHPAPEQAKEGGAKEAVPESVPDEAECEESAAVPVIPNETDGNAKRVDFNEVDDLEAQSGEPKDETSEGSTGESGSAAESAHDQSEGGGSNDAEQTE